ncbi:DUF3800 domain-containing protein [Deinococcus aestuarii]|uniref:DUF3800 domain-containing protein n=1 Tax=Deinococcus aestuarii TaxID=2774531 RepID=UPI001C0AB554|nr:DUF3800 domain-containing protein [Deinococcus aestuarii]
MTPRQYIFALDEFERGDLFLFGTVILKSKQYAGFVRKWNKLRLSIKEQLIKDDPGVTGHKHWPKDGLPEIHAVSMFQSDHYYRLRRPSGDKYYLRQYAWLEEALKIVRHFEADIYVTPIDTIHVKGQVDIKTKKIEESVAEIEDFIGTSLPHSIKRELLRLRSSPYATMFPYVLDSIEQMLRSNKVEGSLICDHYEDCKGLSILDCYEIMRERGYFTAVTPPQFSDSHTEPLLQAADVVSYVLGRYLYPQLQRGRAGPVRQTAADEIIGQWYRRYISPRLYQYGSDMPSTPGIWSVVTTELALRRAGGEGDLGQKLRSFARAVTLDTLRQMSESAVQPAPPLPRG